MKYIALLRGINVSSQRMIKMKDLVEVFKALEFTNIKTYLQSGNAVFGRKLKVMATTRNWKTVNNLYTLL